MEQLIFIIYPNKKIVTNNVHWLFDTVDVSDIKKIIIKSTNKELPFFIKDFIPYLENEINYLQLIEQLNNIKYVRNIIDIQTKYHSIDQGSLWELKKDNCVLVNTDFYFEQKYCKSLFE